MIKKLTGLLKQIYKINAINRNLQTSYKLLYNEHFDSLKNRYSVGKSLNKYSFKAYSQNDEDGIIHEIFERIGTTNKVFIEFGVGHGLESNSYNLLLDNWTGLWIEGSIDSCNLIRSGLKKTLASGKLKLENSFITAENIDALISKYFDKQEIDLLSVDIDGNDYYVLNNIKCVNPRVITIEYNAKLMPHISWVINYKPDFINQGNDYHGASLKFLEVNLGKLGYSLVGCCLAGVNAFFVRTDLLGDKFQEPYTAENHYQPPRYYLSSVSGGHPASYEILEDLCN
jgi:hypothetical protein